MCNMREEDVWYERMCNIRGCVICDMRGGLLTYLIIYLYYIDYDCMYK
jgi:hypothetical protein